MNPLPETQPLKRYRYREIFPRLRGYLKKSWQPPTPCLPPVVAFYYIPHDRLRVEPVRLNRNDELGQPFYVGRCPLCHTQIVLDPERHTILGHREFEHTLTPSLVCPDERCGWHIIVKEGWGKDVGQPRQKSYWRPGEESYYGWDSLP